MADELQDGSGFLESRRGYPRWGRARPGRARTARSVEHADGERGPLVVVVVTTRVAERRRRNAAAMRRVAGVL